MVPKMHVNLALLVASRQIMDFANSVQEVRLPLLLVLLSVTCVDAGMNRMN